MSRRLEKNESGGHHSKCGGQESACELIWFIRQSHATNDAHKDQVSQLGEKSSGN